MQGDSAGSNPRYRFVLKKSENTNAPNRAGTDLF